MRRMTTAITAARAFGAITHASKSIINGPPELAVIDTGYVGTNAATPVMRTVQPEH